MTDPFLTTSIPNNAPHVHAEVSTSDEQKATPVEPSRDSAIPVRESSSFFTNHKTFLAFLLVMVSVVTFFLLYSKPKEDETTYMATRGTIKRYVKVTGQVEASQDANLSFQTQGSTAFVGVKIGDTVKQGTILATLTAGDAQALLLQAQGNLTNAQAKLAELRQGARKEEIAFKEQALENANNTLDESYSALPDAIHNVDATTADIVKNKFSSLFTLSNGSYTLSFSSCDQKLARDIEQKRDALEVILAKYQEKSSVITSISSVASIDSTFEQGYQAAIATNDLVSSLSNLLLLPCSLSNGYLDSYRVTLSTVKPLVTALFSDITLKRSALSNAKNLYNQAKKDLALTKAGTDPYKIQQAQAQVTQARAQVTQAQSNLDKTILRAPFNGVVSNVALTAGETAIPGKTVISIISIDGLQVEAKVPEVEIVKVSVGAVVDVTLDAYGKSVVFPATVTRINPTALQEEGVPMYKVIVTFIGKDERVKQGMTSTVNIVAQVKENVVFLPARFVHVITENTGEVFVVNAQGEREKRPVGIGIRGNEGELEITQGILEGDRIVPLQ